MTSQAILLMPMPTSALPKKASVVVLTMMRPAGNTGVQTHTRVLLDGLAERGIDAPLITPFSGRKWWKGVFAIRRLVLDFVNRNWALRWYRHWHFVAVKQGFLSHARSQPVTHVVATCPLSARAALEVRRQLGRDFEVSMVCHFAYSHAREALDNGQLNDPNTAGRIEQQEADVFQAVDRVIYVSNSARKSLEEARNIRPKRSVVIWNGLADDNRPAAVDRRSLGLTDQDLVLLMVGSLERRKNQMALVDLFARIAKEFDHAKLVLVGEGPDRAALRRRAHQLGIEHRVKLLGQRGDVPALLAMCDLYIHYSLVESFGLALLESARAGVASAALPSGGVPEVQAILQGGVLLHPSDENASMQILRPVLGDAALRADLGRRGREHFQRFFTRESMVESYLRELGLVAAE
jgi:glycosyltransferase involved in cell wall biosynthesis